MKLIAVSFMIGVAALSLAQVQSVATGKGVAKNDARAVEFNFRVTEGVRRGGTVVAGSFKAVLGKATDTRPSALRFHSIERAVFDGNKATFSGPAEVRVAVRGKAQWLRGVARATVVDNQAKTRESAVPDGLSFEWTSRDGSKKLSFRGSVARGDITVRSRK